MELFNPYNNQVFIELINFINSTERLEKDSFINEFLDKRLHLPEDSIKSLTNQFVGKADCKNANLFVESDIEEWISIIDREDPLPIRFNVAELSWLYYVLNRIEASFFLKDVYRESIIDAIQSEKYIDISKCLIEKNYNNVSSQVVKCITDIVLFAIKTNRTIMVNNVRYIIYKLEYYGNFDEYRLILYPVRTKNYVSEDDDIVIFKIDNTKQLSLGTPIDAELNCLRYYDYIQLAEKCLKSHLVKEPIELCVLTKTNKGILEKTTKADDRCAYLFSNYDTTAFVDKDDNLHLSIRYYDFQKKEVMDNILSLGKYIKVMSPQDIVGEVKALIRAQYELYYG